MATEYDAQFLEQQTYDRDVETILANPDLDSGQKKDQIEAKYIQTYMYGDLNDAERSEAISEERGIVDEYDADVEEMAALDTNIERILTNEDHDTETKRVKIIAAYKETNLYKQLAEDNQEDADKKAEEIADMATEYDAQLGEQETYDRDVETILANPDLDSDKKKDQIEAKYTQTYMYGDLNDAERSEAISEERGIVDDYNDYIQAMTELDTDIENIMSGSENFVTKRDNVQTIYRETLEMLGQDVTEQDLIELDELIDDYERDMIEHTEINARIEEIIYDNETTQQQKRDKIREYFITTDVYTNMIEDGKSEEAQEILDLAVGTVDDYRDDVIGEETTDEIGEETTDEIGEETTDEIGGDEEMDLLSNFNDTLNSNFLENFN